MAMIQCIQCRNDDPHQFTGHEDPDVYDGVLVWQCMSCGWAWPRHFGMERRDQIAEDWADKLNHLKRA